MKKRPKEGTPADLMLDMLERAHPEGVPTAEIAREVFGSASFEDRARVARTARALREMGYRVYAAGGVYYLGTRAALEAASLRFQRMACGFLRGGAEAAEGVEEAGDPARARELRRQLKEAVLEALERI